MANDASIDGVLNAAFLPGASDELVPFLDRQIGGTCTVLHELVSDYIHLDVLVYPPHGHRDCWTFVTSGVSSKPMQVERLTDPHRFERCEIVLQLPADWFTVANDGGGLTDQDLRNETKFWPVGVLKMIGRAPHEYGFWIGAGHSFPNGDPPEPYRENVPFSGLVLSDVEGWVDPDPFLRTTDGMQINFLALNFVHSDEMDFKLDRGAKALFDLMRAAKVTQVLDVDRPSVLQERGSPHA